MGNTAVLKNTILLFTGLFLVSCEVEKAPIAIPVGQEVFFEVSYINFAWGEQASVLFIKSNGEVMFNKGKNKYESEDSKGQLTEAQLKENLALAKTTKKQIPLNELEKYSSLISELTDSNFSKKTSGGADRGSFVYTAYKYSEPEKIYKAIKLAEEGDWSSANLDPNAKKITNWLKTLQLEIN
jgi:hypothetical protein